MIGITLGRLSRTFNKNHIQIVPKNIERNFFLLIKLDMILLSFIVMKIKDVV